MIPLSIVIATFNRSAYLLRTLESLAGQTLPAQEFEILVVNNNSTDDTPAVFAGFARQHPELRLRMVAEPVQGISYARNRGVAEAEGECIVFIDDDEEAVPDFAKSYRDFFRSRPDCDAAGGAVVPVYEAPLPRWYSHYIEKMITASDRFAEAATRAWATRVSGEGCSNATETSTRRSAARAPIRSAARKRTFSCVCARRAYAITSCPGPRSVISRPHRSCRKSISILP